MTADDATPAAREPRFDGLRLLLPVDWWTVDLRDADARRRTIADLVERQVGRSDERAAVRADVRRQLTRSADDAAAAGGQLMAVSLMTAGGVPVPASLTVYRLPVAPALGGAHVVDAVAEALAQDETDARVERGEGPCGPLVRRVATRRGPAELGGDELPLLVVDYWLDPGDDAGLVNLTFSTPLVQVGDALVDLFDAVAASVAPTAPAAPVASDLQGGS